MTVELLRAGVEILRYGTKPFVYACGGNPPVDAGQFYWGRPKSFLNETPLTPENSTPLYVPDERFVDINTEDDWILAERMYAALHQKEPA